MSRARHEHDRGAAASRTRRAAALVLLAAAPLVFAGCHDEERLRRRLEGPPARLPVEPDQPETPPAPALLDTVRPLRPEPAYPASLVATWNLVSLTVSDDVNLTFRVPTTWPTPDGLDPANTTGHASNLRRTVDARARVTQLDESEISLATYAAQLAEGNPLYQYTTTDGHVVYVTRREVALAPSNPEAAREVFHTAVVSIDGKIAKLDVRYHAERNWQYDELANAVVATLQVRRTAATD